MSNKTNPDNTGMTAEEIAEAAWDNRKLNPYRLAAIEEFAGESLLDVGCGNGAYVLALRDRMRTFGLDIKRYPSWEQAVDHFDTCDAATLPVQDNSFETVTSFEVLEHIPNTVDTLREFSRVATKNVIFSVPNCEIPESFKQARLAYFHYTDPSHVNFFTEPDLRIACESAGLIAKETRPINPCNMLPVVVDLFGAKSRIAKSIFKRLFRQQYFMTLLVVAEVPRGNA